MMSQLEINEWYHHEVLSNPADYPNLHALELRRNKYNFDNNTVGGRT